jgi:hypothetical protein
LNWLFSFYTIVFSINFPYFPKKSKAKISSNVLDHLIDEVDGTDIEIKKDSNNGNKIISKTPLVNAESEIKPVTNTKPVVNDVKVPTTSAIINSIKIEKEVGSVSSRKRRFFFYNSICNCYFLFQFFRLHHRIHFVFTVTITRIPFRFGISPDLWLINIFNFAPRI